MSNPAIKILANASSRSGIFRKFVIEDNIGESIHLHIENMRVDFTIMEFFEFSSMLRNALNELNPLGKYNLDSFDENFLKECACFIHNLYNITIEREKISSLKCINRKRYFGDLELTNLVPVKRTSAFKFLKGTDNSFIEYPQCNYLNVSNTNRLLNLKKSLSEGYPLENQYIVIFSGQNIIKDGQHRLAILADLYGEDYEIDVMKFHFYGKRHYYRSCLSNTKKICYWLLKKVYHKFFQK